jgi:D-alanine-D-alanine ligase-like ATP-grasp enzyme
LFGKLPSGSSPLYSYEAKWIWDTVENPLEIFTCPAKISATLERKIKAVCQAAFPSSVAGTGAESMSAWMRKGKCTFWN